MKIAVLDGGVIPEFKDKLNIIEDLIVNSENIVVDRVDDVSIVTDHGLNVCKIINMYAPEAEIVSIRIFNDLEMRANIDSLIAAFRYCLDNNIAIIHLSGGTINLIDDYILKDLIKKIIDNGQIIVAAHSNSKGLSFPALYPSVFSARAMELFNCNGSRHRWGYSFLMPSEHKIHIDENISYITQVANSYAAPFLTASIYNIISSSIESNNNVILRNLGEMNNIFLCELPFFLNNVAVINLSGEVIQEKSLSFKLRNVYEDITFVPDCRDYIFISNHDKRINTKKFSEFLNILPQDDYRIRIFYLGKRDSAIESMMSLYPFEFWVLAENEIYPISEPNSKLNECATIYFQGNKDDVYYVMVHLRDFFLEDGFNCFAISGHIDATLYGIYYFDNLVNSIRRKQLEYVFEPDVKLIYGKTDFYKGLENSMLIEVLQDNSKIKFLISEEDTTEEVYICNDEDIKRLFQKIISS